MAGPNVYDKIISGSFDAVGAPPLYRAEDYASIYAQPSPGIRPSWTMPASPAVSPYMTGPERLKLEQQIAASKAMQATMGQTPTAVASAPPLPQMRPGFAPSSMDLPAAYAPAAPVNPAVAAATGAANPVTNVTGQMKPATSGGLLDLILGPSKNGMSGLLGLLGGPQAGGLLGLLSQQRPAATASAPRSVTPSQAYALANSAAREMAGALIGHSGSGSSSGNLMGVSSSGRRFDLDTNQWVGGSSSKSKSSSSGSRNNEYLGASN